MEPVGGFRYVAAMGSLIGYARVSTAEQSADLQTDELSAAGCLKVFVEHLPGRGHRLEYWAGGLSDGGW